MCLDAIKEGGVQEWDCNQNKHVYHGYKLTLESLSIVVSISGPPCQLLQTSLSHLFCTSRVGY